MKQASHYLLLVGLIVGLAFFTSCKKARPAGSEAPDQESWHTDRTLTPEYDELEESAEQDSISEAASDTPVARYSYSWTGGEDIPPLVIIVDDFGEIGGSLLEDFLSLPEEVNFAILPDLRNTKTTAQKAAQSGREVLIHMPMEALGGGNPGQRYVKTGMTGAEIGEMVTDFYAQMPMAVGANNHMGSKATSSRETMSRILDALHEEDLYFVDSFTHATSLGFDLAKQKGYRGAKRDIFLDVPDNTDGTIISKIESLKKYAGRREPVVIITHCHNRQKLEALSKFITQVKAMGVKLINLSAAVKRYPA
ncbi:MAG: divergent polysaccharide deacetylase family protein [Candidatus Cloacimonetes bacterium]|nr:divergent polysaccharide deacetylase family protein [Candidatus Cloacimonadota bacterium]